MAALPGACGMDDYSSTTRKSAYVRKLTSARPMRRFYDWFAEQVWAAGRDALLTLAN